MKKKRRSFHSDPRLSFMFHFICIQRQNLCRYGLWNPIEAFDRNGSADIFHDQTIRMIPFDKPSTARILDLQRNQGRSPGACRCQFLNLCRFHRHRIPDFCILRITRCGSWKKRQDRKIIRRPQSCRLTYFYSFLFLFSFWHSDLFNHQFESKNRFLDTCY